MPSFMLSILKGKFLNNSVLNKALDNVAQVTHVVTYIEYGSELHIELEYEGLIRISSILKYEHIIVKHLNLKVRQTSRDNWQWQLKL